MTTVGLPAAGVENEPVWMPRKVRGSSASPPREVEGQVDLAVRVDLARRHEAETLVERLWASPRP